MEVILRETGGRVSWSPSGDLIAHSRYGEDAYYDLWLMKPDGSGAECLTEGNPGIPQLHNGCPAWHPGGRYIVFQSQDPNLPHGRKADLYYTQPGHGWHNNLWVTDPGGKHFYRLTAIEEGGALVHPGFSLDGSKLLWSEKVGDDPLDWAIRFADFVESPSPHLENIETYQPAGSVFYEAHDFSSDGGKILTTIAAGDKAYDNYDVYEFDPASGQLTNLTTSPTEWDEHAHYSPDGGRIAWMSGRGYEYSPERWAQTLKTDLWVMESDGSGKERITYFNEPGHPEYRGENVVVSDNCWSPEGDRVAALVATPASGRGSADIVIIDI